MIAKPSRLSYDVRRWESRQAKRAAKVKDQRAKAAEWRKITAAVKARDAGICRVCWEPTKTSGNPALLGHCHHIVFRSYGRDDSLTNLIHVHAKCHEAIHLHLVELHGDSDMLLVEDMR